MQQVDLMLTNAAQVVTCGNNKQAKRGQQMRDVGIIEQGAIAVDKGLILDVGESKSLNDKYFSETTLDLGGKCVIPGLVDCHTHVPYGGNRYDEFEMRVQGQSYMDIMNAGGGILSTVRATRETPIEELMKLAQSRLMSMLQLGTTTVECKTGYGLSADAESKLIQVILRLAETQAMTIVPTYLGAHTKPPEFDTTDAYLESIYQESLPNAHTQYQGSSAQRDGIPMYVDIFVEEGVFTVEHMIAYFERAIELGLPLKAHVDQFEPMGAVPIAVKMGVISVDHLEVTPTQDLDKLAQSETVGVMLPTVNFNLGMCEFGNARYLIDANGILALATDYNPGSSPTISLPLVMAIACRYQKLLPAEALNACTINAAAALQLEHRVGSIEVGKQADFVVLNTGDYRAMIIEFGRNFVERVYIKGVQA